MKIVLSTLKRIHQQGKTITFEYTHHPLIPNSVLVDGAHFGGATKATIKAFKKFLLNNQ